MFSPCGLSLAAGVESRSEHPLAEAIVRKMGRRDNVLTTRQVAEKLGLSEEAIRARCCRGQIPYHKRHGVLYFSENEITEYYLNDPKDELYGTDIRP